MKHIKPGRGPSMMSAVMGVVVAVFGVIWTIGAAGITSGMGSAPFGDPFGGAISVIFPLFGVIFVAAAIAIAVYNFKNATGKKRYSTFDIVDSDEEPDPLNERFGVQASEKSENEASAFCPYCGAETQADYRYCKQCGKRLPGGN